MTRARAKLLGQQVNSLLIEYDVCDNENFILPKSMHLCMIRVVDNTSIGGGPYEQQESEHNVTYGAREELEECAKKEEEENQRQPPGRPRPAPRPGPLQKLPASRPAPRPGPLQMLPACMPTQAGLPPDAAGLQAGPGRPPGRTPTFPPFLY